MNAHAAPAVAALKVVADRDEAKAYLHPVRMKIAALLAQEAMTISGLGRAFGVHPANLSHHLDHLVSAGLVRVIAERTGPRRTEKLYRAVARAFEVKTEEDDSGGPIDILMRDLAAARGALRESKAEGVFYLKKARIAPSSRAAFAERLAGLVAEFAADGQEEGCEHSLALALYPGGADFGATKRIVMTRRKR